MPRKSDWYDPVDGAPREGDTMSEPLPAWISERYCPNSRDGAGHSQEWWDYEGACLWCGKPADTPAPPSAADRT